MSFVHITVFRVMVNILLGQHMTMIDRIIINGGDYNLYNSVLVTSWKYAVDDNTLYSIMW